MNPTENITPVLHNSYFDGMVQSLGLVTDKGKATVGVMKAGKYTFGTSTAEEMVIISGALSAKLPESEWAIFLPQQSFSIAANESFDVSCEADVAYICYYQ
jgi:uncharacterized protein YaiE (UPF0345 family)